MNLFTRVRSAWTSARASLENPSVPLSLAAFLGWLGAGEPTASGEIINVASAMQITTVYRCVRLLAESVASLPLVIYASKDDGSRQRVDHDLTWILASEPNDEMSASAFWEAFTGNMAAAGNGYAEIIRDRGGAVRGLYPLSSGITSPRRNSRTGVLEYATSSGLGSGVERVIPKENMIHCPLLGFDGLKGFNPITLARQMLGLARATEKFGSKFFGNGAFPSGIITPDPAAGSIVTDKQKADLKESWERNYGGENQRRVAVLTAPWKWQALGISPEDSQFLGTQQFTRSQIAGLFGVAPHKVGDTTRLSNNNHEQESLAFVTDTLRPYLNRIEQELERKLLPRSGPNAYSYQIEFDVSERLRGDFVTTQEGMALGRQWGWLSANDVRRQLGLNPLGSEGDVYLSPLNMVNAKQAAANTAPPPAPAPAAGQAGAELELEGATDREGRMLGLYAAQHAAGFVRAFQAAEGEPERLRAGLAPVVAGLADTAAREMPFVFWPDEMQKRIAADALEGILRRMRRSGSRFELSEQLCRGEFRRLVRAIHIQTAREGAAIQAEHEVHGGEFAL
jgi:HK97 family phage portal protein